jgi:hypothetical protein
LKFSPHVEACRPARSRSIITLWTARRYLGIFAFPAGTPEREREREREGESERKVSTSEIYLYRPKKCTRDGINLNQTPSSPSRLGTDRRRRGGGAESAGSREGGAKRRHRDLLRPRTIRHSMESMCQERKGPGHESDLVPRRREVPRPRRPSRPLTRIPPSPSFPRGPPHCPRGDCALALPTHH